MSIGTNEIPPDISVRPKVKRWNPPIGSRPIIAMSSPISPEITPFTGERPDNVMVTDRPNVASAKYWERRNAGQIWRG